MRDRFMLVRFVTALAIGAMVSFVGVGCGDDDNNKQQDAGQHDAPVQDDVAVQKDALHDTAVQSDAANPSGLVVVLKATPQVSGNAVLDQMFGAYKLSYVTPSWDSLNHVDNPTTFLDARTGPFGCYAKYYKRGQAGVNGGDTDYVDDTANAGDVSVTGYTKGAFLLGLDDGGVPITATFPDTITCKREEFPIKDDAGVDTDAGTGLYTYNCDNTLPGQAFVPVTDFLAPGTDKLEIKATGGGLEVPAFDVTEVDVAPFIKVMPNGTLWGLTSVAAAYGTDAGVPLGYACGDTDAGVDTAQCQGALAIQITWTDVVYHDGVHEAASLGSLAWNQERGHIQCSKVGAANSYNIPWEIWNSAFPTGSSAHTIQTFVIHFSVKQANGGQTTMGAGGGQLGVTWQ
jgi:hypothetical protein